MSETAAPPPARLRALDGLRGCAALVVVLHHVYQIARPYLEPTTNAWAVGSVWWVISSTPIKLLTAGTESVLVFFVLSGLVVPLPILGGGIRSWLGLTAGRLIRLYIPVWGSLVVAGVLLAVVPHDAGQAVAGSWFQRTNATSAPFGLLFSEAGLVRKSFSSNTVLWSVQWELIFTFLLPFFVLLARLLRRHALLATIGCFALVTLGKFVNIDALLYLPVFFLGTLLAVNLDAVRDRCSRWSTARGWTFLVVSALAIVVSWMVRPVLSAFSPFSMALGSLTVLGAAGVVVSAVTFAPWERALSGPRVQWLGGISFSLYLVHLPILVAITYLVGDYNWWLAGLIGIPVSVVAAWAFNRAVEHPSHRLARTVRNLVVSGTGRAYVRIRATHVARLEKSYSSVLSR